MKLRIFLFLPIIILASCNKTNVKYADSCEEFNAIDLQLLNTIESINEKYKREKLFLQHFKNSQIYWIQYRDRQVRALYPLKKEDYSKQYGESYGLCKCKELTKLSKIRLKELERWLNEPNKTAECPNSIM